MPVQDFQNALNSVLETFRNESLRYGGAGGFPGIGTALASKYLWQKSRIQFRTISNANGSAGCIDLICDPFYRTRRYSPVEGLHFQDLIVRFWVIKLRYPDPVG
ncbi:MAG: hypothetical protein CM1200mP35_10500 [Chloroflexota bacterium]|nr:MAG: hypothetical protein CM1200mP35_10500 [Chloroflexota bacterium]